MKLLGGRPKIRKSEEDRSARFRKIQAGRVAGLFLINVIRIRAAPEEERLFFFLFVLRISFLFLPTQEPFLCL